MDDQKNVNRITFNINQYHSKLLNKLAEETEQTKTEIVTKGISAYALLVEVMNKKAKLVIKYPDGQEETIRFLGQ